MKCKICKTKAVYREGSPGNSPDYFCSIAHWREYGETMRKRGFFWRALPLGRIDGRWSGGIGTPFDKYEEHERLTLEQETK